MPVRRPQQPRYNTVATSDEVDAAGVEGEDQQQRGARSPSSRGGTSSSSYSSVPAAAPDDQEIELETVKVVQEDSEEEEEDAADTFSVTILDFTHSKFTVRGLRSGDAIKTLKQKGAAVHRVPIQQQRLVYRGKLLQDADTLQSAGINADGLIVHLFPKPRVVVVNSSSDIADNNQSGEQQDSNNYDNNDDSSTSPASARVPTIVLDADEAAQRSQILVLGSVDYIEAVNNVKLFSFMLLIISSIELLNLTAIALGNGQALQHQEPIEPWEADQDDFFDDDRNDTSNASNYTNTGGDATIDPALAVYETWQPLSYLDVVVSVAGVYVALLGIRASNENRWAVARNYLVGTCAVAVGWLVYNYILSLEADEAVAADLEEEEAAPGGNSKNDYDNNPYNNSADSVYDQAFQVMVLPAMVWCLCIFRAWQFQSLLAEAEQEAAERIAAQVVEINNGNSRDDDDDDEELALQNAGGVMS